MRKILFLFLAPLALLLLSCEEMPLKRNLPDNVQKLHLPPIENRSAQPNVDQLLTQKTTDHFIVDGRLRIVSREEADVVLQATLQRYDKIVITRDENQVPTQYRLQVMADLDFTNAKTGALLWTTRRIFQLTPQEGLKEGEVADFDSTNERSLREFTTFYVLNNAGMPPEDEATASERVLGQMARRIVRRVIEGF